MPEIASDLFGAGSATVKDAVEWIVFYLAMDKGVQKTVQMEIANVIGAERDPTYADRVNMPFTQAVIQESLRLGSSIPINLVHM